ncbi:DUF1080 domain-containing protein [Chitinophaga sp. MM2321]|uniref:3-keto-disaccharide hydrolase n=1 Tax=Chitinophaga sp. MM2321 TaxID=3137178 RepID=UPI0032D5691A
MGNPPDSTTIRLFNGQNLDGWYTFLHGRGRDADPKKVFTVNKGMLRVSGEEFGCITSDKEYDNYKLIVEFRWGDRTFSPRTNNARDNGILMHSTGADGAFDGTWMHSFECQLIEGGSGDFIVVGDGTDKYTLSTKVLPEKQGGCYVFSPSGDSVTVNGGRINWYGRDPEWKDVLGFRGKQDVERTPGKWNRMECICRGDEIFIVLNGKLVNHAFRVKPSRGRIQIQSEGAEIFFRRIDLRELK